MRKFIILFVVALLTFTINGQGFAQSDLPGVGEYTDDARAARIVSYKQRYRIALSDKEKELVVARCREAQDNLNSLSNKAISLTGEREKTYASVIAQLTDLRLSLDKKQVDSSNVDLLIVAYQQKMQEFSERSAKYELALDDSLRIDCQAYPEDFRAALEAIRGARKEVVEASGAIMAVTTSDLKTTFDSVRLKLETSVEAE